MDQFFTKPEVAARCLAWMRERLELDEEQIHWVEPSVGAGAFYRLLPEGRRTGFELDPALAAAQGLEPQDFLQVLPLESPLPDRPLVFAGNPPFGHRARLAAAFVNHCFALGAEYVGMILPPMLLPSTAGGVLAPPDAESMIEGGYSIGIYEELDPDYELPEGGVKSIPYCGFVLYRKGGRKAAAAPPPSCASYVDLHFIVDREKRQVGLDWIPHCDFFLADSFFPDRPPELVGTIEEAYYSQANGIIIKKDRERVLAALEGADWLEHSKGAPNKVRHITQRHIRQVLLDAGLVDPVPAARTCHSYIRLHGVGHYKERGERDQERIQASDCFLPAATMEGHREGCRLMPYPGRMNAIGLELLKERERLYAWLKGYDWAGAAKRSTNRNLLLNRHIVWRAVIEGGFVDGLE